MRPEAFTLSGPAVMLVNVTLELVVVPVHFMVVPAGTDSAVAPETFVGVMSTVTVPLMLEGVFAPTTVAVLEELPDMAVTASVPGGLLLGFGVQKFALPTV